MSRLLEAAVLPEELPGAVQVRTAPRAVAVAVAVAALLLLPGTLAPAGTAGHPAEVAGAAGEQTEQGSAARAARVAPGKSR